MTNTKGLSIEQHDEARKHEKTIDDGLSGYVEVGFALRAIQDKKLHPGRFIDYAMDRFALKKHTIYRLIRAADVAKNLMDAGLPCPKNAGQAHRIHDFATDDPEMQIEIWKNVVEGGVPAALSQIEKVAQQFKSDEELPDDDDSGSAGDVDLDSEHYVEPKLFTPSDADPLPCLIRAEQELKAVANAIDDGFDDLPSLEDQIEQIAELLEAIRSKIESLSLAV